MKGSRKDPTPKILYMDRNWVGSVASVKFTFYLKPLLFKNIAWTLDSWSLQATGPRLRFPGMRWEWPKGCRAILRWVPGIRPDWEPSRESDQSYNLGSQGTMIRAEIREAGAEQASVEWSQEVMPGVIPESGTSLRQLPSTSWEKSCASSGTNGISKLENKWQRCLHSPFLNSWSWGPKQERRGYLGLAF